MKENKPSLTINTAVSLTWQYHYSVCVCVCPSALSVSDAAVMSVVFLATVSYTPILLVHSDLPELGFILHVSFHFFFFFLRPDKNRSTFDNLTDCWLAYSLLICVEFWTFFPALIAHCPPFSTLPHSSEKDIHQSPKNRNRTETGRKMLQYNFNFLFETVYNWDVWNSRDLFYRHSTMLTRTINRSELQDVFHTKKTV